MKKMKKIRNFNVYYRYAHTINPCPNERTTTHHPKPNVHYNTHHMFGAGKTTRTEEFTSPDRSALVWSFRLCILLLFFILFFYYYYYIIIITHNNCVYVLCY